MESVRESEKNATFHGSVGHICQDTEISKLVTVHAQFVFRYLSTTVAQLLFDVIKPCGSCFCSFSCTLSVDVYQFELSRYLNLLFFPYKKNIQRGMEKKHKNPFGNFCPGVPIMHLIGACLARSKYHLTIKKNILTPDCRGLVA